MPTWSGILQGLESGKAGERPIVDDDDLVAVQDPVKGRYELAQSGVEGDKKATDTNKIGDMPTWSGIIQGLESGKAGERPIVDDGDLVGVQVPVKARYERAW